MKKEVTSVESIFGGICAWAVEYTSKVFLTVFDFNNEGVVMSKELWNAAIKPSRAKAKKMRTKTKK